MFRPPFLPVRFRRVIFLLGGAGISMSISGHADSGAASPQPAAASVKAARPAAEAGNAVGFKLLRQGGEGHPRENVFLSPTSLSLALAMAYNGAGGATKAAMAHALGVPDD